MRTPQTLCLLALLVGLAALGCLLMTTGTAAAPLATPSLPAAAAVTLRYVSPAGSDAGACDVAAQPCRSPQYAVNVAAEGDQILLATGVYSSPSTAQVVNITRTITLRGGYDSSFAVRNTANYPTTLDGQGQGRPVVATGAVTVTLDGLRLVNGLAAGWGSPGGGIYAAGANLRLVSSQVISNHVIAGNGSGVYLTDGSLTMSGSLVQQNGPTNGSDDSYMGGGLYLRNASVEIRDSQVMSNTANRSGWIGGGAGGGISLDHCNSQLQNVTLQGNLANSQQNASGGGLYATGGTLRLLDSAFINNVASGNGWGGPSGGGAAIYIDHALVNGNTFVGNTVMGTRACAQGCYNSPGGGVDIGSSLGVTVTQNTFQDNWATMGGGFSATSQRSLTFTNNQLIGNAAVGVGGGFNLTTVANLGVPSVVTLSGNLFQENHASNSGAGLYLTGPANVLASRFVRNTAGSSGGAIYLTESSRSDNASATWDGDVFDGNHAGLAGGALDLEPVFSENLNIAYRNLVFLHNTAGGNGGAINFHKFAKSTVLFQHLTLADNAGADQTMVRIAMGRVTFQNTILSSATIGVRTDDINTSLDHTLTYQVVTPTLGSIAWSQPQTPGLITGNPLFDTDGYHLTSASPAVDAGMDAGVHDDVDGDPRPLGNAPDLGADESAFYRGGSGMQASLIAGTPQWRMIYTGQNTPPSTVFEQDYLIPFGYWVPVTAPVASSYSLQDNWPASLALADAGARPPMTYSRNGNVLTFGSLGPLNPGGWGAVSLLGRSNSVSAGQTLATSGQFAYTVAGGQQQTIDLQASTEVPSRPMFAPLLLSPQDGEMCLDDQGQLAASGLASAGLTVRLYENGTQAAQTTADSEGNFTINWTTSLAPLHDVSIYTTSCAADGTCSGPSRTVHLTYPQADWCAQRSYWEGDTMGIHYVFHFRDDSGRYASNGFVLPGVYGFQNTQLHLYACCDLNDTNPFKVTADGVVYNTPTSHSGRWWVFTIGMAHSVSVESQCQGREGTPPPPKRTTHGTVLIDPDGFAFDAAQGGGYSSTTGMFVPQQPVAGITVTAYYSATEWGTWIPWPAQLYDDQRNPQVTGASGYFAFFTPPGQYYLQAEAAGGFQAWRSPVIDVITQVVHVNIPLAAWHGGQATVVTLSPGGPSPATAVIPTGGSVEWQSALGTSQGMDDLRRYGENPVVRPLSARPPLTDTLGFDGGLLAPGQVYRHQFDQKGAYAYTDGLGHTATVEVGQSMLYLPLVRR